MVKVLIATGAVFALMTAASAADLPQRQPAPPRKLCAYRENQWRRRAEVFLD